MKEATVNKLLVVLFIAFAAALYGLIFGGDCGGPISLSAERSPAPDFTLPDMSGKSVSLSDFHGKAVFLNVWATWCAPCRREMPDIQSLARKMNPEQFVVMTVSVDQGGREDVATFFRGRRLDIPTLLDPEGRIAKLYGVTGYPETFLIDKQGRMVERFIGPRHWLKSRFMELFRSLAEE
jgi:peroxiredoxin